ncbi:hypothetical protein FGK63_04570 [Ruegeria sediminis]|uniref:Dioxygenase n=1 Tax=Ruegeria sediminis TaxID=2583820 RepID=A0ABY2X4P6_9RHOB|nr:hypothetical protein [Ruegeria sediminis]TMV10338.1 hypothetical protein FGK63_04570 [Ruegeria sediminis]
MTIRGDSNHSAIRLTDGPAHHFFGFHDLEIDSRASGSLIGLRVARIDRPPLGKDAAEVIVFGGPNDTPGEPRVLLRTKNYNFPQGARQHWLGGTDTVIVNEVDDRGQPASALIDGHSGVRLGQLSFSTYCTDRPGTTSYSVDFGRLHRLGGYGHSNVADRTPSDPVPADNGIFVSDIAADRTELLLSIGDVAKAAGVVTSATHPQFITHLRLNPSNDRIAFLHRFRLADGGEETVLCAVGADGTRLRILARGYMSHFDWLDDTRLMIWGRRNQSIAALRRSPLMNAPVIRAMLPCAKAVLRRLLRRNGAVGMSYLEVHDGGTQPPEPFAAGILTADGHPMVNPAFPDWLVTDTYPDARGIRDLMLYHPPTRQRIDLGQYRKINDKPSSEIVTQTKRHIEAKFGVAFPAELYAFTRSGLHCDLHPRWFVQGGYVAFDSIHEGTRQIYATDVSDLVTEERLADG